jgi:DNA gyrase/topoisomerase IV subunit A
MFKFFKKGPLFTHNKKEPKDLKEVLDYLKKLEKNYEEVSRELVEFKKECQKDLQKFGVVRFNPFKEVGGEQSFSIAVLDANNNGFVITSHYGRESNRVYAKPIENGKSEYQLSAEEEKAINKAIHA